MQGYTNTVTIQLGGDGGGPKGRVRVQSWSVWCGDASASNSASWHITFETFITPCFNPCFASHPLSSVPTPMSTPSPKRRDPSPGPEPAKKRRRGATRLSCAECRRLKLRCDRGIPCGSCLKRGCGAICPDGSLTTGQGNRFVLASTQELHEKITELCSRVRDLEDALRTSHSQNSSEPHPLLSEELLRVKAPLQRESPLRNPTIIHQQEEENNPDVIDSFGTLAINRSGHTNYYGQFANSWNEMGDEPKEDPRAHDLRNILPAEILQFSGSFPLSPIARPSLDTVKERLRNLHWYLPTAEKAAELRDLYYTYAAWMNNPISAPEFNATVYSVLFNSQVLAINDEPNVVLSHRLSVMFMVLAIGSLMDTRLPSYNVEAEKYHQLARAALFQNNLFDEPTLGAVQALYLMSFYLFFSDRHGSSDGSRWAIMGMAAKLAQSVNRDTGRWKLDAPETQRRREVFWELYVYDSWQCLTFGRPPTFATAQVDCKMPFPQDPSVDDAFNAWKHRFSSECIASVHDQVFGAKTPTYATILQLDRKLRAYQVPPVLQIAGFGSTSSEPNLGPYPESIPLTLQRHIVLAIREINLLYMHRGFFARALSDHPKDPLGSPYGTSVIAAYRSAGSLIALMRNLHSQLREPLERMWFLWTHMFSCAIILGSIVTRSPSLSLAPSALVQLDSACTLFSKAAKGFRAEKVLEIMVKLREKAHASLQAFKEGKEDELSTLGGKTRLVGKGSAPTRPVSPQIIQESPTSHNPVIPFPLKHGTDENVHPTVLDYLRSFEPTRTSQPSQLGSAVNRAGSMLFTASPLPDTFFDIATSYPSPPVSVLSSAPQTPQTLGLSESALDMSVFPTYFPVFDYGGSGVGELCSPIHLNVPMPEEQVVRNTTPEASMQNSWQDLIAQFGLN
ncbi:fungal-specific transcription factor domain-containing protein [Lactarius hengduanensis]|nr:fungal-specific transcription factor domain-containing protein [Lactarius hengduanensis]